MVAVDGLALDGLEGGEALAQVVELVVDLVVVDDRAGDGDPQAVVAADAHLRTDLDHGVEGHRALLLARGDVDLGRGDGIDLVVGHRAGVVVGQGLAQGLFAGEARPDAGLEHLPGRLPGRKPGIRTSLAILRKASSIWGSNSSSPTETLSLTLLSSRDSTVVSTGVGV
ncbi:MAG: hypothetical protein U5R31_04785 [Acidimicrobiia bacterium]|nr:hypothetical protein [Acidimicrobiia bacterium]